VLVEERRERGDLAGALRAFRRLESELGARGMSTGDGARRQREALFLCREADRLRRRGALADAHRVYRAALRQAEHHAAPHLGLAEVAQARGRAQAAIRFYRRAAERGGCELALHGLERLEAGAAEREAAAADRLLEELALRGLTEDRTRHQLRRPLIRLYRRRGDARQALNLVKTAVQLGDRSPWILLTGAEIAEELGDTKTALELLRSGLDAEAPA
jgi:tetratricopeptide (TPR) repeat protein